MQTNLSGCFLKTSMAAPFSHGLSIDFIQSRSVSFIHFQSLSLIFSQPDSLRNAGFYNRKVGENNSQIPFLPMITQCHCIFRISVLLHPSQRPYPSSSAYIETILRQATSQEVLHYRGYSGQIYNQHTILYMLQRH